LNPKSRDAKLNPKSRDAKLNPKSRDAKFFKNPPWVLHKKRPESNPAAPRPSSQKLDRSVAE
jgi:hypothetical protein